MNRIAVVTGDFSVYHDLVRELGRRGLAFATVNYDEEIPPGVGVVLTGWRDFAARIGSADQRARGQVPPVVSVPLGKHGREDYEAAIHEAQKVLAGVAQFRVVCVGVDPGDRPGLAVIGDGAVLHTAQLESPREVAEAARRGVAQYPAERHIVRVGHGARLVRNRIVNDLLGLRRLGVDVEIVDETASNPPPQARAPRGGESRHIQAAARIAAARGARVDAALPVEPTAGEVADLQRVSRQASGGLVTVSKERARRVAKGEMSLEEAIAEQRVEGRRAAREPPPSGRR